MLQSEMCQATRRIGSRATPGRHGCGTDKRTAGHARLLQPNNVVNAALSYGYAIILGEAVSALCAAGLDPAIECAPITYRRYPFELGHPEEIA